MSDRLNDYRAWHHLQVATGDIDPAYPVLRELGEWWKLTPEQRAWMSFCHVVYYHLGSGLTLFTAYPEPVMLPATPEGLAKAGLLTLPTATERRAHRDVRQLAKHLLALREAFVREGVLPWVLGDDDPRPDREVGWEALNLRLMELHGNGRWAAYKLAEMLQKVAGLRTAATDAGHRHSSGPRKGLADLYGDDIPSDNTVETIALLDAYTRGLQDWVGELDVAQVETSLCDFHSLTKGSYYLGHDIDAMQAQLNHPAVARFPEAWEARTASFAPELRGEVSGWDGVRKHLKPAYRHGGILDVRELLQ